MKSNTPLTTITAVLYLMLPLQISAQEMVVPDITIEFAGLLEFNCEALSGVAVQGDVLDEMDLKLADFVAAWNSNGPALLNQTQLITDVPFSFRERIAVLHVCPDLRSMSFPLIINMRRFLASSESEPNPPSAFVHALYHELLHNYLVYSFRGLPREFGDLPPVAQNHLHLMALEREAYKRLELNKELADIRQFYESSPLHAPALQVVDEKGAEYFLAQLYDRE